MKYAEHGKRVFPCGADKRPLCQNGFKDATTDKSTIESWWREHPDANIGSPTGAGLVVLDVDGEDAEAILSNLKVRLGPLPETLACKTGRGTHLYFRVAGQVRNSAGKLGPGIDVRGDGGYTILPPSKHPNGTVYRWTGSRHIAELPAEWLEAINSGQEPSGAAMVGESVVIPAGQRNVVLTRMAGAMRRHGATEEAILEALRKQNALCSPPLPDWEVRQISKSVSRYRPIDLSDSVPSRKTSRTFRDAADDLLTFLGNKSALRVISGIEALDELTGGYLPGELIVYTAETGVGKTILAQQTRRSSCKLGIHTLFVSAEMSAEAILARELVNGTGVYASKMRRPDRLDNYDWDAIRQAVTSQCPVCRVMDYKTSTRHIYEEAMEMYRAGNLGLLIMDYDELIGVDHQSSDGELAQLSAVAGFAKGVASKLQVPVILVSQLRKLAAGESPEKTPILSRLYSSGAKAKHASIVISVRRANASDAGDQFDDAVISVHKSRNGSLGRIRVKFDLRHLEFISC